MIARGPNEQYWQLLGLLRYIPSVSKGNNIGNYSGFYSTFAVQGYSHLMISNGAYMKGHLPEGLRI